MVAISLYKGNLHKVPAIPRQWPTPAPTISLEVFKTLLHRRSRALARIQSESKTAVGPSNADPISNSNPSNANLDPVLVDDALKDNSVENHGVDSRAAPELPPPGESKERKEEKAREVDGEDKDEKLVDSLANLVEKGDVLVEKDAKDEGKVELPVNPMIERSNTEDVSTDKEKRKKEVQEKLEILKEKKHSLVQALKQILNAEERLKGQNSMQGMSGSPKMASDGNPCGDADAVEADDVLKQNPHFRHLPRMSSTSPSSESQLRKPGSSMVLHTYRTTLGVAGSPSRFAPAGQVHSVSVSGTSYIASSPSPAASGGTSIFRDARQPSPWN